MSVQAVIDVLQRALHDLDFRDQIASGDPDAFKNFELTNEEKKALIDRRPDFFDSQLTGDEHRRVAFIRAVIVRPQNPPPYTVVALHPEESNRQESESAETGAQGRIAKAVVSIRQSDKEGRQAAVAKLIEEIDPPIPKATKPIAFDAPHTTDSADIYIVGLGINGFDQVTPEVRNVLSRSKEVFFIPNSFGTEDYLRSFCPNITGLMDSYQENGDRLDAYHDMATRVVNAALENAPVALAEYGHPTIFAYPPYLIQQAALALGLRVKVLPGISAMDCIFADLMIDPSKDGLQMYEATDLILRERTLFPDVASLIWQIGSLETALYSSKTNAPQRFYRFLNHLLRFYPPGHVVTAIYTTNHPLIPSTIYKFPLWSLPDHAEKLHPGFTLYIPAVEARMTRYFDMAHQIRSVDHLDSITNSGA